MKKFLSLTLSIALIFTIGAGMSLKASAETGTVYVSNKTELINALDSANGGTSMTSLGSLCKIELTADINTDSYVYIGKYKNIQLDLKGYTLSFKDMWTYEFVNHNYDDGYDTVPCKLSIQNGAIKSKIVTGNNADVILKDLVITAPPEVLMYYGSAVDVGISTVLIENCEFTSSPSQTNGRQAAIRFADGGQNTAEAKIINSTFIAGSYNKTAAKQSPVFDRTNAKSVVDGDGKELYSTTTEDYFMVGTGYIGSGKDSISQLGIIKRGMTTGSFKLDTSIPTTYSIDITWGSMEFDYQAADEGVWNADTLTFDGKTDAAWSCDTDANKITVTNKSNAAVEAALAFAAADGYTLRSGFYNATTAGTVITNSKLSLASAAPLAGETTGTAKTAEAYLQITGGTLTSGTTAAKIGTVTVTIN